MVYISAAYAAAGSPCPNFSPQQGWGTRSWAPALPPWLGRFAFVSGEVGRKSRGRLGRRAPPGSSRRSSSAEPPCSLPQTWRHGSGGETLTSTQRFWSGAAQPDFGIFPFFGVTSDLQLSLKRKSSTMKRLFRTVDVAVLMVGICTMFSLPLKNPADSSFSNTWARFSCQTHTQKLWGSWSLQLTLMIIFSFLSPHMYRYVHRHRYMHICKTLLFWWKTSFN